MKSRKFLLNTFTENTGSAAKGFLLARSPRGDVAAVGGAVRRYELQHNQSPRFTRRRQERRKGQALLLAVLIMLLAALLSAGFLAVVSGNLNQSARISDKTRAIEASRAGIAYANAQLSGSSQGDLWRPVDVSPAPAPGSTNPDYNYYYSQLDKVQGWANSLTPPQTNDTFPKAGYPASISSYDQEVAYYRNFTYGKFPDPNHPVGDAPKFLVKVQELPTNLAPNDPEYDHSGQIKITSIGLSDDDPNVFHRAVAYKMGRAKSPWASALRSVSNWDWKNNVVPQTPVSSVAPNVGSGTTTVTVTNADVKGVFPAVPFNVVLSHKDINTPANSKTFGGVVTAVAPNTDATKTDYTVTGEVAAGDFVAQDTMQVAAALGTAQTIDLLNTGKTPATPITASEPLLLPTQDQPNGILANGSLWLQGQYRLTLLQKAGSKIQSAGAVFLSNTTLPTGVNTVPTSGDVTTAGDLTDSSKTDFPGTFATSSGVKTDLINDAWNRLGTTKPLGLDYTSTQTQTRVAEPFKPVKIDSATNLARYRALTRNSANGVYIDNRDDIEKVGTTPMTQAQLTQMWTSDATTSPFFRNGTAGGTSLEEKHLRGWIAPDEFMARGALVELLQPANANPYIRVTYDARSDTNFNGPDPAKAARDANGDLRPGVYSENLPWPKNGTLFAEGNIRIRGKVNLANLATGANAVDFPSLTVVSLGNIYIEGSVSVDGPFLADGVTPNTNRKKLMLLAKKNVVVNPTRLVLGHVDEQTLSTNTADIAATGTAPNQSVDIPVDDATAFKVGDVIETYDATPTLGVRGVVTAISPTVGANTITATLLTGTTVAPASSVKTLLSDKTGTATATGATVPTKFAVADASDAIARRVLLQDAATQYPNLRLMLDHLAQRKNVFKIETEPDGSDPMTGAYTKPGDLTVKVTNKRTAVGGTFDIHNPVVATNDKRISAVYNKFTAAMDVFPNATTNPFTDPAIDTSITPNLPKAENQARGFSLAALEAEINALPGKQNAATKEGWKYKATNSAVPTDMPFFYLAGIGLRNEEPGSTPPATTTDGADIGTTAYDIPLAMSVRLQRNGTDQNLTAFYAPATPPAISYTVPYFGFNPLYGVAGATPDANAYEDALTVDQSFYQTDPNILKSILDSRATATNLATDDALVLRENNDLLTGTAPIALPEYRVRALKLENTQFPVTDPTKPVIKPVNLDIDAYVYAQEGSWFVIPSDYFRTDPQVRAEVDANGIFIGTYIDDVIKNGMPDAGEYILDGTAKVADLNRNGIVDPGEAEAAFRFVRYNYRINFYGAIVENQTPVVADVKDTAGTNTLAQGAVQDWMDKWVAYNSTSTGTATDPKWKFINYSYDPSLANATPGANQLRVPVTDDLLYQQ